MENINHNSKGSQIPFGSVCDPSTYESNVNIPLEGMTEVKGGNGSFKATYLSWAHAIRLLNMHCPNVMPAVDLPCPIYMGDGNTAYISCYLMNGEKGVRTPSIFFPIMDNMFKALQEPDSVDVNKSIQRGITKAIAIYTGIGLKLYMGEDVDNDGFSDYSNKPAPSAPRTPANPATIDKDNYMNVVVPVGKMKGKEISDLSDNDLEYWANNFKPTRYQDSQDFRKALDLWLEDRGLF